jgi:carbon starvation protein CstA
MERRPPTIEMTPDGRFTTPPRSGLPLSTRILIGAVLVAVIAGMVAVAALAFWLAVTLIPIALIAGLIAYVIFRIRIWQARRSVRRQADLYRP